MAGKFDEDFNKVWKTLGEISKLQEKSDKDFERMQQEFRASQQEFRAEFKASQKESQASQAKLREVQEETKKELKETGRYLKKLGKLYGGSSRNTGYAVETYFQKSIRKTLVFAGIQFDEMFPNIKKEGKKGSCEFDILLVNHVAAAIIEAKHRPHPSFVREMVEKKLVEFRKFFPEHNGKVLYLGIAGMSMPEKVIEEAKSYGIGILIQEGGELQTLNMPLKEY